MRGLVSGLLFAVLASAAPQATYEQALSLYNKTDYAASIAVLRTLPESAKSLELMGRCYLLDGEYKKATEALEKGAQLDPTNSMMWTWLGRAYGRRAETSFALNALTLANKTREAFEKAVKLDPKNHEAVNDLFEYYFEAPGMVGGGRDKARNLLPLIAKNDPAEAAFAGARLAEEAKEHKKAEEQLREAVDRAPKQRVRGLQLIRHRHLAQPLRGVLQPAIEQHQGCGFSARQLLYVDEISLCPVQRIEHRRHRLEIGAEGADALPPLIAGQPQLTRRVQLRLDLREEGTHQIRPLAAALHVPALGRGL